jgi:hypothetical protein
MISLSHLEMCGAKAKNVSPTPKRHAQPMIVNMFLLRYRDPLTPDDTILRFV